jgi:HD-like signal output (HDOD) protein
MTGKTQSSILVSRKSALRLLEKSSSPTAESAPAFDLHDRINKIEALPPLPEIVHEIIKLYNDPFADAASLARIVEKDPALAAQVLRWANSAMYGFKGEIKTVKAAIARVLGFDIVMNLAMGLTTVAPLKVEKGGPIGMQAFWVNAILSASLCQRLAGLVECKQKPNPGIAYLTGLLHNLWVLVFGHLLPAEHKALNELLQANPQLPLTQLSEYLLGVNPISLGLWLLQAWELPAELVTSIAHQNDPYFKGEQSVYPNLVYIADALLQSHGFSYAGHEEIPAELLTSLGLEAEQVNELLTNLLERKNDILSFSAQLVH